MATNSSTSNNSSTARTPVTGAPEIVAVNGQALTDASQTPTDAADASQTPEDACLPGDPATIGDDLANVAIDALEDESYIEAKIDEIQSEVNEDFDLETFFSRADSVLEVVAEKAKNRSKKEERTSKEDPQRCVWPKAVEKAASAAGIRLPGLYPKKGSKSAKGADNTGWFRELPKTGVAGEPGRGDFARELLWELAGSELYTKGSIPTAQLLAAAAMIKRAYGRDRAQAPDWTQHLISPGKQDDGTTIGLQTCLMHQITLMAASSTILRPGVIIRVGKVKA